MSKIKLVLCVIAISTLVIMPANSQAALPPKAKAFLVMCAYGTVGGALLGFASLAFQNNNRAIAQGASLGLYAGMIFGGYVLASHKKPGELEEYPPGQDPYQQQGPPPPGFGPPGGIPGEEPPPSDGGFFGVEFKRVEEINLKYVSNFETKKGTNFSPPIYIPIYNLSF